MLLGAQWMVNTPERTLITTTNYSDNKYFPAHLERMRLNDLKNPTQSAVMIKNG